MSTEQEQAFYRELNRLEKEREKAFTNLGAMYYMKKQYEIIAFTHSIDDLNKEIESLKQFCQF